MSTPSEQLVVRQHERVACQMPVDISVASDSPTRVSLSRTVGNGTGILAATVVDCSGGGVGVESAVFLPRQTRVFLRIHSQDDAAPPLELEATVQRASMVSRAPRYYLGLSFRGKNPPAPAAIASLLKHAARSPHIAAGTAHPTSGAAA